MQNVPPTASQTQLSTDSFSTFGHRKGMVIASLNANSLLLHIDEIRKLVKELGIHILALNETVLFQFQFYILNSIHAILLSYYTNKIQDLKKFNTIEYNIYKIANTITNTNIKGKKENCIQRIT